MIPEFNQNGNLPDGIYVADEEEFLNRFGMGSARRKWLAEKLKELFALAKSTGNLERIFVWGSFVSGKEAPNDVDLLLLMRNDFQLESVSDACKILFDYVGAKVKFHTDIFWSKSSIEEETLKLWLDTYQTTKDFKRRGILEVRLS